MSFTASVSPIDTYKIKEVFGYEPTVNFQSCVENMTFSKGKMIVFTGAFYEIIAGGRTYKVCPASFSKRIDSVEIKGEGFFEGDIDEEGKKLIRLFFSNHKEGAVIYLNDQQRSLIKKEEGSIHFK